MLPRRSIWRPLALRLCRATAARRVAVGCWLALALLGWPAAGTRLDAQALPTVRISQLYSNSGFDAPADYVELFNAGSEPVAFDGWRVESATGGDQWQQAALPPIVLAPGGYLLVAPADITVNGETSAPDARVEFDLPLDSGSVRVLDSAGAVADQVGYGSGSAEGNPAPAFDGGAALWRGAAGCADTQDNAGDFTLAPPAPRTLAAPPAPCAPAPPPTDTPPTDTPPTDTPPTDTPPTDTPPTDTPTALPEQTPGDTPTVTPTATDTPAVTPTETPTVTPPPPADTPTMPAPPPPIFLSEIMPEPLAHENAADEWVELHNPNAFPVNLYNWSLATDESGPAVVGTDVVIPPGGYTILSAGAPDRLWALGVTSAFQYRGLVLQPTDRLLLIGPDGAVMDQVAWGDSLPVGAGISLERSAWESGAPWLNAWAAWPGGQGELGTPGRPYSPPPPPDLPPTPLPTAAPTEASTPVPPSPTLTPTPTLAPPLPPSFVWLHAAGTSPVQIDEIAFESEAGEYAVLLNTGDAPVSLSGWSLADAEAPGDGEAVLALPDVVLPPGAFFTVARDGAAFQAQWGRAPDAQVNGTAPAVPVLAARPGWGTGPFALSDAGDELLLLDPAGSLADAVVYGDADPAAVGLEGTIDPPAGLSLQRVPGAAFPTTLDQRHRFTAAPPNPFISVTLPGAGAQQPAWLTDGLSAAWGSLGAHSNFSAGRVAPPHLVAARAAAAGLDFVALADPAPHAWLPAVPVTLLPAWSPPGVAGAPIVYSAQPPDQSDPAALAAFIDAGNAPVQGWGAAPPEQVVAFDAGRLSLPDDPGAAFHFWQEAAIPLIPAGNGDPADAWGAPGQARFTGLAVTDNSAAALEEALRARRGWLTSAPGLLLTLRAELPDGQRIWMGQTVAPANSLYLHVQYSDRAGQSARLEMWRNAQKVKEVEPPPVDGFWTVALPALPGDVFFALARQSDGDFAFTAPVMVSPGGPVVLQLNEVYPLPTYDGNGDGVVDSDDEFIELYNPGVEPAPLEGWLLSDVAGDSQPGRRHAFAAGDFVPGQGRRVIWRGESHVNLNNDGDRLRLLRPDASEVDGVAWGDTLAAGSAVARLPDGGAWQAGLPPSPGEPNRAAPPPAAFAPAESSHAPAVGGWESTAGQADGPPGSVAYAKRMGVNAAVEFRATVVVPPGLFTNAIYVGDLAADGILAHLGLRVYLPRGNFPSLQEGDQVVLRGVLRFYHGELELRVQRAEECRRIGQGAPLAPLPVTPEEVGESVEGRFVTFVGAVSKVEGDSLYIADLAQPTLPPVRVTVARSLEWSRPRAEAGQVWKVTGVVSQYAAGSDSADSRSGYRVLVRWPNDLMRLRP